MQSQNDTQATLFFVFFRFFEFRDCFRLAGAIILLHPLYGRLGERADVTFYVSTV